MYCVDWDAVEAILLSTLCFLYSNARVKWAIQRKAVNHLHHKTQRKNRKNSKTHIAEKQIVTFAACI